jgi:hypothetical protein
VIQWRGGVYIQRCHLRCLANRRANICLVLCYMRVVVVAPTVEWDGLLVWCDVSRFSHHSMARSKVLCKLHARCGGQLWMCWTSSADWWQMAVLERGGRCWQQLTVKVTGYITLHNVTLRYITLHVASDLDRLFRNNSATESGHEWSGVDWRGV